MRSDQSWLVEGFDPIRSVHDAIRQRDGPEVLSEGFGRRMREEFIRGTQSTERVSQPVFPNPEALTAEQHLMVAAYLSGIVYQPAAPRCIELAAIGCCATKHLLHTLLRVSQSVRKNVLWEAGSYQGLANKVIGSLAEAQVAMTFLEAGHEVFATTIDEDLNLGGDLLVPFRDTRFGLMVQVKSVQGYTGAFLRTIDPVPAPRDGTADPAHEMALEKLASFNASVGVRYRAVIAAVGPVGDERFSFYVPGLIESVQNLIRGLPAQPGSPD